jgi:hypothetical protein
MQMVPSLKVLLGENSIGGFASWGFFEAVILTIIKVSLSNYPLLTWRSLCGATPSDPGEVKAVMWILLLCLSGNNMFPDSIS